MITFTPNTIKKVKYLLELEKESNPALKLRVQVAGGGCSGFQYGFTFDEKEEEGDFVHVHDGVTILVDCISMQYLEGATVDYVDDLTGAHFSINNPQTTATCGCGSSFSI